VSSRRSARALGRARPRGPRAFVQLVLHGGLDAVLTTNPRTASEVEPGIDVPYRADEIVDAGSLRLGPHFLPLRGVADGLAIVNGVQVQTANHNSGSRQIIRLKTGVDRRMPALLQLVGDQRDGQPIGWLTLGAVRQEFAAIGWFGAGKVPSPISGRVDSLIDDLDATEPADLLRMAHALKRQAEELARLSGSAARTTAVNLSECAALLARLPQIPPFREQPWSQDPKEQLHARNLQRILWILENDLTRGVHLNAGVLAWDTHEYNAERQRMVTGPFITMFARFLAELRARRTVHGRLADSTLVVVSSELGRFPRLNGAHGKDHFPEAPFLFFGGGIRPGVYGRTGRQMESLPVSLKTGGEGTDAFMLDDVGTTLLHLAGMRPELYGYRGRILEFLG
jgi:hypothetical protein